MEYEEHHVRSKKAEEMKERLKAEEQVRATLRLILDEDAYARLANVKLANPELYAKAVQGCVAIYQRIGRKLGDKEMLLVLRRLKGNVDEPKIKFERK